MVLLLLSLLTLLVLAGSSSGRSDLSRHASGPPAVAGHTVTYGDARFTILTSAAIRLEHSGAGSRQFVDAPSTTFVHRVPAGPVPAFEARASPTGELTISTAQLVLRWDPSAGGGNFTAESLSIALTARPGWPQVFA